MSLSSTQSSKTTEISESGLVQPDFNIWNYTTPRAATNLIKAGHIWRHKVYIAIRDPKTFQYFLIRFAVNSKASEFGIREIFSSSSPLA